MIKVIIFDLDGTLLNTIEDIHYVLNESLEKFSLPKLSLAQTTSFVGNGAKKLIEDAVGDVSNEVFEKVYRYYLEKFSLSQNERTKFFENEEVTLFKLMNRGIKLAIVTNKPQRATDNVCIKYLAKIKFCEVLGHTEYFPLKPNPASTLSIIEKMGVKKEEVLFVGDGETDVLTAKGAGIRCISALWGYRTREQLEAAGACEFAENFTDILNFLG